MASTSTIASRPIPIEGPLPRSIPLHFQSVNSDSSAHDDPMDTSGPSSLSNTYTHRDSSASMLGEGAAGGQPSGAAAAAQQPKVVQTAFIHKLYNMLEDQSIQHLITWSNNNDSFIISPSAEFSKVLAQYFKHTNVSSFVRQLNMYGFHKVSDVFHQGSPDSPLWEFKHGAGNFRRGDFAGLKEIKRRASRHTLMHRDSFSAVSKAPPPMVMGPPGDIQENPDTRLGMLEQTVYELHSRLARSEEANAALHSRCQNLSGSLVRSFQYSHDLSSALLTIIQDPERTLHREVQNMQLDISRQLEGLRIQENAQPPGYRSRQLSFALPLAENGPPMSPYQIAQEEPRRGSYFSTTRQPLFRPPFPHRNTAEQLRRPEPIRAASPPRRSNIAAAMEPPMSPTTAEPPIATAPLSPPNYLSRRHTSADIRQPDWPAPVGTNEPLPLPTQTSPFNSGHSSGNWPSSPNRTPNANMGAQQLRDSLARYQLPSDDGRRPSISNITSAAFARPGQVMQGQGQGQNSRQSSPPPSFAQGEAQAHINGVAGPSYHQPTQSSENAAPSSWRLPFKDSFATPSAMASGQASRRGSVAHLLNPADTAERDEDEDVGPEELRKRKRRV